MIIGTNGMTCTNEGINHGRLVFRVNHRDWAIVPLGPGEKKMKVFGYIFKVVGAIFIITVIPGALIVATGLFLWDRGRGLMGGKRRKMDDYFPYP